MNVRDLLRNYRLIFLDTAPLIFYAERHPVYYALVEPIFAAIDAVRRAMTAIREKSLK
ncbi:MAG: hypothetical protein ACP5RN_05505 [Armatimonadota bacterium]